MEVAVDIVLNGVSFGGKLALISTRLSLSKCLGMVEFLQLQSPVGFLTRPLNACHVHRRRLSGHFLHVRLGRPTRWMFTAVTQSRLRGERHSVCEQGQVLIVAKKLRRLQDGSRQAEISDDTLQRGMFSWIATLAPFSRCCKWLYESR